MPDHTPDPTLERLLAYPEPAANDAFVLGVMQKVQRERNRRRLILSIFGFTGAGFGALGAWLLAEPIRQLFSALPPTLAMQGVLTAVAIVAFYIWSMNDELTLGS